MSPADRATVLRSLQAMKQAVADLLAHIEATEALLAEGSAA